MLGDHPFEGLQVGSLWTGVIEAREGKFRALWHDQLFVAKGLPLEDGRYTFYNFVLEECCDGVPVLVKSESSHYFAAKKSLTRSFRTIVDLCSGLGGMSQGLAGLSGHTLLYVDHSQLAVDTVADNGGRALRGDVTDPLIQLQIHQVADQDDCTCSVTAGIPCQPYSRQGSQLGALDNRSKVLDSILQIGWRLQAACVVLECLSDIMGHENIQLRISEFAVRAGLVLHSTVLELGTIWASRRRRWWTCLVPPSMSARRLCPYPADPSPPVVGDIIPEWPVWDARDEADLVWTSQETDMMSDARFGQDMRVLDRAAQAPTALHSWGNALRSCPCGCRTAGLTPQRLLAGRLRGIGIPSGSLGVLRFLHPCEAALLNTLSPVFRFRQGARAGLCLVGNISAPLQAHWVFATLQSWSAEILGDETPVDPVLALQTFKASLLNARHDLWPVPSLYECAGVQLEFATGLHLPDTGRPWKGRTGYGGNPSHCRTGPLSQDLCRHTSSCA